MQHNLKQKIFIEKKSSSTFTNYSRHLAKLSLHYNKLPTLLSATEINDYLYLLLQQNPLPSQTYFKFTVYSLRYLYKMYGLEGHYIRLPTIKKEKSLPVVLSRQEVKRMLEIPQSRKHRLLLMVLYGCGLRNAEARNIRVADLDFDRCALHVRNGKGNKDRYLPLSKILVDEIQSYIATDKPVGFLFNTHPKQIKGENKYTQNGVRWVVNQACLKSKIIKSVSAHTWRHTFATHLLEDGLDIVSIKELLGHQRIETTMVYLHVAQCGRINAFSPLDTLYGLRRSNTAGEMYPHFLRIKLCEN